MVCSFQMVCNLKSLHDNLLLSYVQIFLSLMLITKMLVLKTEYNRLHTGFFRKPMTFCWGEIGQVLVSKQCPSPNGSYHK